MSDSDQDQDSVDQGDNDADIVDAELDAAAVEPIGPGQVNLTNADDEDEAAQEDVREGPGLAGTIALDPQHLMGALESLILVSDKPIAAVRLARLTRQDVGLVRKKLAELVENYKGRGIVLDEIAGGFQFRTAPRFGPFVRNLVQQKPTKLTRAQLEVLSIIAYRQPVTRPEMEDVRGVDSGSALKVLLERNVIKIIGKKDEAGRPILYGTSNEFLELFGLKTLRDLPTLREFAELTPESRDMFERRIGEPVPGAGMNLDTHYVPQPSVETAEERAESHQAEDTEEGRAAPDAPSDLTESEGDADAAQAAPPEPDDESAVPLAENDPDEDDEDPDGRDTPPVDVA